MIPPRFDYVRPRSVDEAEATLSEQDDSAEVKVLAGRQSLLPVLRLGYPTMLVDRGRAAGFAALVRRGNQVISEARIGLTNMGTTPTEPTPRRPRSSGRRPPSGRPPALAANGTTPPTDLGGRADCREHLARVLAKRAVLAAANRTTTRTR